MKTNIKIVSLRISESGLKLKPLPAWLVAGAFLASFAVNVQAGYVLSLSTSPADGGSVTVEPAQPEEGYEPGTIVTLTAFTNGTNEFASWTGATNATGNPLTIVMDSDISLTANYTSPTLPSPVQIVWQHAHGQLATWFISGTELLSAQSFGRTKPAWKAVDTEDFNDDDQADVVFQHDDGRIAIWISSGTNFNTVMIGGVNPSWRIVAVTDFDRDGDNDILFQHASARLAVWLMDGFTLDRSVALGRLGGGWRVASVYDFDGDVDADILFQHASGRLAIWIMDGTTRVSSSSLPSPARGWRLAGVEDFNEDGKTDFLFQHGDGRTAIWYMDGSDRLGGALLRKGKAATAGWRVIGAE